MDAERYKDQLREAKYVITKLEFKAEKLQDRLEILKDDLSQVSASFQAIKLIRWSNLIKLVLKTLMCTKVRYS
jgi:hypothetical protein